MLIDLKKKRLCVCSVHVPNAGGTLLEQQYSLTADPHGLYFCSQQYIDALLVNCSAHVFIPSLECSSPQC